MANLTYLGDACVLWNSVIRYKNELIYTYSGLFCIAINPYKRFPIYTLRTMELYVGKRRNECWPHIFAIAEGAYQGMCNSGINQSILITGESGAGKTENTKKVISYFATICSSGKRKEGEASLEDKIVQTNPVLEAWGNAKTVRNDNSSRFGKFIRIHFNSSGKLSGADMVVYLLEKSRLTYQQPLERCYHAFYNIMSDQVPDLKEKCFMSNDILDYWFVSQGKLTVPSIDDKEDMQFADEAFDILGFSEDEKYDVFKCTAALMHMGNMTKDFVPVGKEEQAASLSGEVEESKALLDGADRAQRQLQGDIADARGAVNNMQTINGRDMTAKRQLESSIHTLQAEVDGMLVAAKNAEEKSKKAMVDAARLADELRAEQDHATSMGTAKNSLGNQLGELEGRLADAENAAMKGGKAAMAKMEGKIRELEAERKSKELAFAQGEDRKNQDRMSELAAKLQGKIKTYKQQIEEAEEIAALNLAKFRKAQQELEETEERAKLAMVL